MYIVTYAPKYVTKYFPIAKALPIGKGFHLFTNVSLEPADGTLRKFAQGVKGHPKAAIEPVAWGLDGDLPVRPGECCDKANAVLWQHSLIAVGVVPQTEIVIILNSHDSVKHKFSTGIAVKGQIIFL